MLIVILVMSCLFCDDSRYVRMSVPITIQVDLFEEAVDLIIFHEGWHDGKDGYVGYGHKLSRADNFDHNISKEFAKDLVKRDLLSKCVTFREFKKDSLLLGVLAYNVGENNVIRSRMVDMMRNGKRNIYHEYMSFCHIDGKKSNVLVKRRLREFNLLYNKTNNLIFNGF